jgi:hypothetical protein
MEKTKETKAKKEKKFNGERVARQVEKSLKAVFPNETIHVSYFTNRVEVLYPMNSKITATEINTFKAVFCELGKIKKEELSFSQYEKKAAA